MNKIDTSKLDRIAEGFRTVTGAPGLAMAVIQGENVFLQGYGVRALAGDAPVTVDTLFANASTTKAVTATAIALLVSRGKMNWDDPVRRYLPEFRLADPIADAQVTIRDLVCHRTGLPRHDMLWYHSPYRRAEVLRRVGFAALSEPFRTKYQYQNICFAAAGEAVRVASGAESFESFVKSELLTPLGMERTNFSTVDAEADDNHARPHQRLNNKVQETPYLNFDNCGPAGTMNSSVAEMAHWLRFHLSGGKTASGAVLVPESNLRETYLPHIIIPLDEETKQRYPSVTQESYCLGWVLRDYKGYAMLCHGGAIDGFRAHVVLLRKEGIGLCLFANIGGPIIESLRNAVLDSLLGVEGEDWLAICKSDLKKVKQEEKEAEQKAKEQRKNGLPSPLPLKSYVGKYTSPAYGTATVSKEKGDLYLTWNQFRTKLTHQTFTLFAANDQKDTYGRKEASFALSPTGEIRSLSLFDAVFDRTE